MDMAWRFRIMIFTVVALAAFGDFFGYGSIRGVRSDPNQVASAAAAAAAAAGSNGRGSNGGKFQQKDTSSAGTNEIDMSEDPDINELSTAVSLKQKRDFMKSQFSDAIKESCLPKMLCEMASKPEYLLSEKEKDLMHLIRTSTMSLAMNGAPSKWHFAAHMGELLRYTGDDTSGPMGCANLWPNCPISSKKLMKLTSKVKL